MANLNPELPQNFHDKQVMAQARIMAREIRTELVKAHENGYHSKLQHGAYVRLLEEKEADVKQSMAWLRKCHIDAHTEGVVCGAQELAIITKYHEKHILKNSDDDKCRVCKTDPENTFHLLGACDVLAKREYFTHHNSIWQYLHYKILRHYKFHVGENWYRHTPTDVLRNDQCEVIYDQVISTTRPVGANCPDIIVKDKKMKKVFIIDVACPVDTNVVKKEREKIAKYGGLRGELQRMWGIDADVVLEIVGGLGAVHCAFNQNLSEKSYNSGFLRIFV